MTDTEINKAIAEWCGWELISLTKIREHEKQIVRWSKAPNYVEDLNACHEAEKGLEETARWFYMETLAELTQSGDDFAVCAPQAWLVHTATARQRCEALLRTLSKWRD